MIFDCHFQNNLVQLRDKLTTQLDLIKQTQAKSTQNHTGIPQNSIKPLDQPKSNNANKYTQEFKATSGQPKDTEFNTTKALSLSLAPSVAMTLGSGAIPPTIVTPPTNDPKSLLSQPPPTFARQVSVNYYVLNSLFYKYDSNLLFEIRLFLLDFLKFRCWRQ